MQGYTNYRGKQVIGAWTYLKEYGFSIVTEKEVDEAFKPLRTVSMVFYALFTVAGVFALGMIIFSIHAARMMRKLAKYELEAVDFGQYRLIEKIGEGSFGDVYLAEHKMMRRRTALKLLKKDFCTDKDFELFEKEVQLSCQLSHPNTISIYDYGQTDEGIYFYVMEFLNGQDLDSIIKEKGPLPAAQVIHILRQVCASLSEAHKSGLIHRDIKAQNIVLCTQGGEPDFVKVLDFGLVKKVGDSDKSMEERVCGTPTYMAPEAVTSPGNIDARIDIYALGVLGFYLLTGKYPFEEDDSVKVMMMQVKNKTPKPTEVSYLSIPVDLEDIIMECLEKEREKRPASTLEVMQKLNDCHCANEWAEKVIEGRDSYKVNDEKMLNLKTVSSPNRTLVFDAAPNSDETFQL